ncbi:MAG: hypothetical protein HC904_04105 [Blastochloris sp.]|nr:hypothetical protein [Blastochloris sp.]
MKKNLALTVSALLVLVSAQAQDGQFVDRSKQPSVIQKKPEVTTGEVLKPRASGVVFMMSERGLEVFSPVAGRELGQGEKVLTQNIKNTAPASNPFEDKKPYGGIALLGVEF